MKTPQKTSQRMGSHSNGIQATGDVNISNYYGLAVNEVKELTLLFLRENFPVLREEALECAKANVESFLEKLSQTIKQRIGNIDINGFRSPDIQASLNEAVMVAAKKGNEANLEILSNLIVERISKNVHSFISLVADEAITIVPKLLKEHINFLSYSHFIKSVHLNSVKEISDIDQYAKPMIEFLGDPTHISDANKLHLQYAGCINILQIIPTKIHELIRKNYAFLSKLNEGEIDTQIKEKSPYFHKIWVMAVKNDVQRVILSSVGQLIGLTNLRRAIPQEIDYSIWLK